MSGNGQITYNHGAVADLAHGVGQNAAQLVAIHDDIQNRTNAIAGFFEGQAAAGFQQAQAQMLRGFQDLIEVVNQHGVTIEAVRAGAESTDRQMQNFFT